MTDKPVPLNPSCPVAFAFSEELLDDEVLGPDDTANSGRTIRPDIQTAIEEVMTNWTKVHKRHCDKCRDYRG